MHLSSFTHNTQHTPNTKKYGWTLKRPNRNNWQNLTENMVFTKRFVRVKIIRKPIVLVQFGFGNWTELFISYIKSKMELNQTIYILYYIYSIQFGQNKWFSSSYFLKIFSQFGLLLNQTKPNVKNPATNWKLAWS